MWVPPSEDWQNVGALPPMNDKIWVPPSKASPPTQECFLNGPLVNTLGGVMCFRPPPSMQYHKLKPFNIRQFVFF